MQPKSGSELRDWMRANPWRIMRNQGRPQPRYRWNPSLSCFEFYSAGGTLGWISAGVPDLEHIPLLGSWNTPAPKMRPKNQHELHAWTKRNPMHAVATPSDPHAPRYRWNPALDRFETCCIGTKDGDVWAEVVGTPLGVGVAIAGTWDPDGKAVAAAVDEPTPEPVEPTPAETAEATRRLKAILDSPPSWPEGV